MNVHFTVAYLAGYYDSSSPLYEPHMSAMAFVRTLKGKQVNQRFLHGLAMSLAHRDNAFNLFGQWAKSLLRNFTDPIYFIPVPGSKLHIGVPEAQNTSVAYRMAQAAAASVAGPALVVDALRFREPHDATHEGNKIPEKAVWLEGQLEIVKPLPGDGSVVLVDDVFTTGAHLRACRNKLRAGGWLPEVPLAICGARTVKRYVRHPYPYVEVETIT